MKTQIARKQAAMSEEKLRQLVELAARVQLLCAVNRLQLRNRSLTVQGPWGEPVEVEFIDRQPYGFVFTEGQEASFRVPSGHRFVIEQVNVSPWGNSGALFMRLVTTSPRMFRSIEVACVPEQSAGDAVSSAAVTPLVVNGLSANSFLFSDGKVHNSPTVPSDTYLQIWGYLEPSSFPNELLYAREDASPRSGVQADINPAAR